jgi:hypothetical protein
VRSKNAFAMICEVVMLAVALFATGDARPPPRERLHSESGSCSRSPSAAGAGVDRTASAGRVWQHSAVYSILSAIRPVRSLTERL